MHSKQFAADFPGELLTIGPLGVAYDPAPIPPTWITPPALQRLHEQAVLALGELRAIIPALPNPQLLTSPFVRREAVLSSRIEGTHTALEQLMLFEAAETRAAAQSSRNEDAQEVLNYVRALENGLNYLQGLRHQTELPAIGALNSITQWLIRALHQILMKDLPGPDNSPGQYRNCQAHIGSSRDITQARYVPPPPERVQNGMDNLEFFLNTEPTLPSLAWIAIAHYQFEAIHPFKDGNGRTGRLLITLMLIRLGLLNEPLLYLSAYFERNREEYNERMWQVSRAGDWDTWIEFFLKGVEVESRDAIVRARRLLNLRENWREKIQSRGRSTTILQLLDHLFNSPVITIPEAQERFGLSFNGAQKNIHKLETLGFLVETTGQERYRVFVARPVTNLLGELPVDQIED